MEALLTRCGSTSYVGSMEGIIKHKPISCVGAIPRAHDHEVQQPKDIWKLLESLQQQLKQLSKNFSLETLLRIQETTTQVSTTFKTMIEEIPKIQESHSQFLKITKEERMEKLEGMTEEDLRTLETIDQFSKVKELKEIEVLTCNQSMIKILPLVGDLKTQKSLPRAKVEFYWECIESCMYKWMKKSISPR